MFFIMILSGLLSTMNIWTDKWSDIRFSLNDLYMTLLMTGWMFFFMGLFYHEIYTFLFGIICILINIWCIRTQFLINEQQYKLGMIPHHSMAVHMSKKILEKIDKNNEKSDVNNNDSSIFVSFVEKIIKTQEDEIEYLKS